MNVPFLLAESGATKTEWRWVRPDGVISHVGPGLNPNQPGAPLPERVRESLGPLLTKARGAQVHFYGAGVDDPTQRDAVRLALTEVLGTDSVQIETDLLGAARAAAGDWAALVAILGTGSNACRYTGAHIEATRGGHGWLIGDLGSGVEIGRRFLRILIDGDLPPAVADDFRQAFSLSPLEYRAQVYRQAAPALALSQLMPFVYSQLRRTPVHELVKAAFTDFLRLDLLPLTSEQRLPLVSVGSVAVHFASVWGEACREVGFTPRPPVADVASALVDFHRGRAD